MYILPCMMDKGRWILPCGGGDCLKADHRILQPRQLIMNLLRQLHLRSDNRGKLYLDVLVLAILGVGNEQYGYLNIYFARLERIRFTAKVIRKEKGRALQEIFIRRRRDVCQTHGTAAS